MKTCCLGPYQIQSKTLTVSGLTAHDSTKSRRMVTTSDTEAPAPFDGSILIHEENRNGLNIRYWDCPSETGRTYILFPSACSVLITHFEGTNSSSQEYGVEEFCFGKKYRNGLVQDIDRCTAEFEFDGHKFTVSGNESDNMFFECGECERSFSLSSINPPEFTNEEERSSEFGVINSEERQVSLEPVTLWSDDEAINGVVEVVRRNIQVACISKDNPSISTSSSGFCVVAYEKRDSQGNQDIGVEVLRENDYVFYSKYRKLSLGILLNSQTPTLEVFEETDIDTDDNGIPLDETKIGFVDGPLKGNVLYPVTKVTRESHSSGIKTSIFFDLGSSTISFADSNNISGIRWFLYTSKETSITYGSQQIPIHYENNVRVQVANPDVVCDKNMSLSNRNPNIYVAYQGFHDGLWHVYVRQIRLQTKEESSPEYEVPYVPLPPDSEWVDILDSDYSTVTYRVKAVRENTSSICASFEVFLNDGRRVYNSDGTDGRINYSDMCGLSGNDAYAMVYASYSKDMCDDNLPDWEVGREYVGSYPPDYTVLGPSAGYMSGTSIKYDEWPLSIELTDPSVADGGGIGVINSLTVHASELLIAGNFSGVNDEQDTRDIFSWNGTTVSSFESLPADFIVLHCVSDGSDVYVCSNKSPYILTSSGGAWSTVGDNASPTTLLAIMSGDIYRNTGNDIQMLSGSSWVSLDYPTSVAHGLASVGSNLYTASATGEVYQYDGSDWSIIGTFNNTVISMCEHEGKLVVVGRFTFEQTTPLSVYGIASWNGTTWQTVGSLGISGLNINNVVSSGGSLYVSGENDGSYELWAMDNKWHKIDTIQNEISSIAFFGDSLYAALRESSSPKEYLKAYARVEYATNSCFEIQEDHSVSQWRYQESQCNQYYVFDDEICSSPYISVEYIPFDLYKLTFGNNAITRVLYNMKVLFSSEDGSYIVQRDASGYDPTFMHKAVVEISYEGDLSDSWTYYRDDFAFTDNLPESTGETKGLGNIPFALNYDSVFGIDSVHLRGDSSKWVYFSGSGDLNYNFPNFGAAAYEISDPVLIDSNATRPKIEISNSGEVFVVYEKHSAGSSDIYIKGTGDFAKNSILGSREYSRTSIIKSSDFAYSHRITSRRLNQLPDITVDRNEVVHVCWQSNDDSNWNIFYANAENVFDSHQITKCDSRSGYPSIGVDENSNVYITYHDNRTGKYQIYLAYKNSESFRPLLQQPGYISSLRDSYTHYTNILPIELSNPLVEETLPPTLFAVKNDIETESDSNYLFSVDMETGLPIDSISTEDKQFCAIAGDLLGNMWGVTCSGDLYKIADQQSEAISAGEFDLIGTTTGIVDVGLEGFSTSSMDVFYKSSTSFVPSSATIYAYRVISGGSALIYSQSVAFRVVSASGSYCVIESPPYNSNGISYTPETGTLVFFGGSTPFTYILVTTNPSSVPGVGIYSFSIKAMIYSSSGNLIDTAYMPVTMVIENGVTLKSVSSISLERYLNPDVIQTNIPINNTSSGQTHWIAEVSGSGNPSFNGPSLGMIQSGQSANLILSFPANTPIGSYSGVVSIFDSKGNTISPGFENSVPAIEIPYTLNVIPKPASIEVSTSIVKSLYLSDFPASYSLFVWNPGDLQMNVTSTIVENGPGTWLYVTPSSFTLNGRSGITLDVVFDYVPGGGDPPSIPYGSYTNSIVLSSQEASNSPKTVSVLMNVIEPKPVIDPISTIIMSCYSNETATKTFTVRNSGTVDLNYEITPGSDWMTFSSDSGVITPGNSQSIIITATPDGHSPGVYISSFVIGDTIRTSVKLTVPVRWTLLDGPPEFDISPSSLTFTATIGSGNPQPQSLSVVNSGGKTLNYSITDTATWLSVSPATGVRQGNSNDSNLHAVSVSVGSLSVGTYNASIRFSDGAAANHPLIIPVVLNIVPDTTPIIRVSTNYMYLVYGYISQSLSFDVWNGNSVASSSLNYSISSDQSWLSLLVNSGTSNGEKDSIPFALINPASLSVGTHRATVTISDSNSVAASQTVIVDLVIEGPSVLSVNPTVIRVDIAEGQQIDPVEISIQNTGGGEISYSVDVPAGVTTDSTSGSVRKDIDIVTLDIETGSLSEGETSYTVTVSGSNGDEVEIDIVINVHSWVYTDILVDPSSVNETVIENGVLPAKTIKISNTGAYDTNISISSNLDFLSINLSQFSLLPGNSMNVLLAYDTSELSSDSYSGELTISYTGHNVVSTTEILSESITVPISISVISEQFEICDMAIDQVGSIWLCLAGLFIDSTDEQIVLRRISRSDASEIRTSSVYQIDTRRGGVAVTSDGTFWLLYYSEGKVKLSKSPYPVLTDDSAIFDFSTINEDMGINIISMTVDHQDVLYGIDEYNTLYTIDKETGTASVENVIDSDPYSPPYSLGAIDGIAFRIPSQRELVSVPGYYHVYIEFYDNINLTGSPAIVTDSRIDTTAFIPEENIEDPYLLPYSPASGVYLDGGDSGRIYFYSYFFRPGFVNKSYPYGFEKNQTYFPKVFIVPSNGETRESSLSRNSFSCNNCRRTSPNVYSLYNCSYALVFINSDEVSHDYNFRFRFFSDDQNNDHIVTYDVSLSGNGLDIAQINNAAASGVWTSDGLRINTGDSVLLQIFPGSENENKLTCGISYAVEAYVQKDSGEFTLINPEVWAISSIVSGSESIPISEVKSIAEHIQFAYISDSDMYLSTYDEAMDTWQSSNLSDIIGANSNPTEISICDVDGKISIAYIDDKTTYKVVRYIRDRGESWFDGPVYTNDNISNVKIIENSYIFFKCLVDGTFYIRYAVLSESTWRVYTAESGTNDIDFGVLLYDGRVYLAFYTNDILYYRIMSSSEVWSDRVTVDDGPFVGTPYVFENNTDIHIVYITNTTSTTVKSYVVGGGYSDIYSISSGYSVQGILSACSVLRQPTVLFSVNNQLKVASYSQSWIVTTPGPANVNTCSVADMNGHPVFAVTEDGDTNTLSAYVFNSADVRSPGVSQEFMCDCSSTIFSDPVDHIDEISRWNSSSYGKTDIQLTDTTDSLLRPKIIPQSTGGMCIVYEGKEFIKASRVYLKDQFFMYSSGSLSYFDYDLGMNGRHISADSDVYGNVACAYEQEMQRRFGQLPMHEVVQKTVSIRTDSTPSYESFNADSRGNEFIDFTINGSKLLPYDKFINNQIVRKVRIKDVDYVTCNAAGESTPVVSKCKVILQVWGTPEVYSIRMRNDNEEYSDWKTWSPEITEWYSEFDWELTPNPGIKQICLQVMTYAGATEEFCLPVVADYVPKYFDVRFYKDYERSIELPNFENMPVASIYDSQISIVSNINISSFASADISVNGSAVIAGNVLRLTELSSQSGSGIFQSKVSLKEDYSFSTEFSFRISDSGGTSDDSLSGGDGIAFVMYTGDNSTFTGNGGNGIGYGGVSNCLAVEFDTYKNDYDPDGNHIGVNVNGDVTSIATSSVSEKFNDGAVWHAWIEYNGTSKRLLVRVSQDALKPTNASLSVDIDISTILSNRQVYVGFTSGTGTAYGKHDIISWSLDTFNPKNSRYSEIYVDFIPNSEIPVEYLYFDVIQQGLEDSSRIKTENGPVALSDGRMGYKGKFFIKEEDNISSKDGIAQVVVRLTSDCFESENKVNQSSVYYSEVSDKFNILGQSETPSQNIDETSSDVLGEYRQVLSGRVGPYLTVRPQDDPYFVFGDPDYYLERKNPEQKGIQKPEIANE